MAGRVVAVVDSVGDVEFQDGKLLDGFREIVDGVYDDDERWPEPAFILVGSIDEMREKARFLSTGRFPRVP